MFPLFSDIGLQARVISFLKRVTLLKQQCIEFLISQGISTEARKVTIAKKQLVRRVASLPLHIRDESDTSPEAEISEPLRKRPRLDCSKAKPSVSVRPVSALKLKKDLFEKSL